MSILLPALSDAREQARRIDCLANQKTLALAWYNYAMNNDEKLCSPDTLLNDPDAVWPHGLSGSNFSELADVPNWVADGSPSEYINPIGNTGIAIENGALWTYVENLKVYKCKSDKSDRLRSYSMSVAMGPSKWPGISYKMKSLKNSSLLSIPKPDQKMVFIDATSFYAYGNYGQVNWLSNPFQPVFIDVITGKSSWWRPLPELNSRPTDRHSNGCNLSFADMHCEYWKWRDKRTVKWIDRQMSTEEASEDNPDLKRMIQLLRND